MLSENLKRVREEKGYSKYKLARETGLSSRCIEHLEYEISKNPRIDTLIKISKVLNVTVDDLIK